VNVPVPANVEVTGTAAHFLLIVGSHWAVHQVTIRLR